MEMKAGSTGTIIAIASTVATATATGHADIICTVKILSRVMVEPTMPIKGVQLTGACFNISHRKRGLEHDAQVHLMNRILVDVALVVNFVWLEAAIPDDPESQNRCDAHAVTKLQLKNQHRQHTSDDDPIVRDD